MSTPGAAGAELAAALEATLAALDARDVTAAAAASERVAAICAAIERGAPISASELTSCLALHARCAEAADRTQAGVVAALLQSATHRRASDVYGSTT